MAPVPVFRTRMPCGTLSSRLTRAATSITPGSSPPWVLAALPAAKPATPLIFTPVAISPFPSNSLSTAPARQSFAGERALPLSGERCLPLRGERARPSFIPQASNSPSSHDSVNKLADKLDQLVYQAQSKAVRATQPYPLTTSVLVLFCVANFLTQYQLIPSLTSLDFNHVLNTLVPAAFSTHTPREFVSIGLGDVSVRSCMPGIWLALIASFTHINLFHLWVTTSLIKDIGEVLEPHVGSFRTLGVYIAGAALSCWASVSYSGSALLGASGAASALLGALLLETAFHPGPMGREAAGKLWSAGVWLLVLGFTLKVVDPRVYLWGAGGGVVASVLLGLLPMVVRPLLTVLTAASAFGMLAVMAVAMLRKVHLI